MIANHAFIYSDASLKTNIQTIPNALDDILKLRGVEFNWKKDGSLGLGVIAQEVEAVYPQLVQTDKTTGLKSVEYGSLVAPIIEAVKELADKVVSLAARVDDLFNKFTGQDSRIQALEKANADQRLQIQLLQKELQAIKEKIR